MKLGGKSLPFCRSVGEIPFTYLGLELCTTRPIVLALMLSVDRMERKLFTIVSLVSQGIKL